jgi:hypothetical protein
MPEYQELKDQARAKTRSLLAYSHSFRNMDREEQMALYKDLMDAHYKDLAQEQGLATEMAVAGDLINEDRHNTPGVKEAGKMLGDFVKNVDFPGFVRDLLNGVFEANLNANIKQMEAFQNLLREATKSLAQFVSQTNDDEALLRLVQTDNEYKLSMAKASSRGRRGGRGRRGTQEGNPTQSQTQPETKTEPGTNESKYTLVDKNGKEVNLNNNAIQAKILDAKLALAKERRTMLRETILMGVSRLVVEKGIIRASVNFTIDSFQDTFNTDTADVKNHSFEDSFSDPGFLGNLWGGTAKNTSKVSISTSNAKSESGTETSLAADMSGFVEIQFKSDYFKLDNFRETFDLGQGQVAQVPAGAAPPQQLPPQAPPPAPTDIPQV